MFFFGFEFLIYENAHEAIRRGGKVYGDSENIVLFILWGYGQARRMKANGKWYRRLDVAVTDAGI